MISKKYYLIVILLMIFSFSVSTSASADEYTTAAKAPSPLKPSNKPFKSQERYSSTEAYKAFVSLTRALQTYANKKFKYSSSRTRTTRSKIVDKINANLKAISYRQNKGALATAYVATTYADKLHEAAYRDLSVNKSAIIQSLISKQKKYRKTYLQKFKQVYRKTKKRYNKAYTKASRKKLYNSYLNFQKKINAWQYQSVLTARAEAQKDYKVSRSKYHERLHRMNKRIMTEWRNSLQFLNKRSSNEVKKLRLIREKAIGALKRLSTRKFSTIKAASAPPKATTKGAKLPSASVASKSADLPELSFSFKTPEGYRISKNYISKKVLKQIKKRKAAKERARKARKAKERARKERARKERERRERRRLKASVSKVCSLGAKYNGLKSVRNKAEKNLRKSANLLKILEPQYKARRSEVASLENDLRKALQTWKKEKRIRLERPNDSYVIRAKKRYYETKRKVKAAKVDLKSLSETVSRNRRLRNLSNKKIRRAKSYSKKLARRQKRILSKSKVKKAASSTCSGALIN